MWYVQRLIEIFCDLNSPVIVSTHPSDAPRLPVRWTPLISPPHTPPVFSCPPNPGERKLEPASSPLSHTPTPTCLQHPVRWTPLISSPSVPSTDSSVDSPVFLPRVRPLDRFHLLQNLQNFYYDCKTWFSKLVYSIVSEKHDILHDDSIICKTRVTYVTLMDEPYSPFSLTPTPYLQHLSDWTPLISPPSSPPTYTHTVFGTSFVLNSPESWHHLRPTLHQSLLDWGLGFTPSLLQVFSR